MLARHEKFSHKKTLVPASTKIEGESPMSQISSKACIAMVAAISVASSTAASEIANIPDALQAKIDAAEAECASFNDGEFALEEGSVQRVDLDGDNTDDWVLNEVRFACSTAASLYGGTGGSMSHFLVGAELASIQNQGWEITQFGPHTVLLARVHGSNCDGINPTPCVVSSVWDGEAKVWRSASAAWE